MAINNKSRNPNKFKNTITFFVLFPFLLHTKATAAQSNKNIMAISVYGSAISVYVIIYQFNILPIAKGTAPIIKGKNITLITSFCITNYYTKSKRLTAITIIPDIKPYIER